MTVCYAFFSNFCLHLLCLFFQVDSNVCRLSILVSDGNLFIHTFFRQPLLDAVTMQIIPAFFLEHYCEGNGWNSKLLHWFPTRRCDSNNQNIVTSSPHCKHRQHPLCVCCCFQAGRNTRHQQKCRQLPSLKVVNCHPIFQLQGYAGANENNIFLLFCMKIKRS